MRDYDAVFFIGGLGVKDEYWDNPQAHQIARDTLDAGKILAAVCWGPVVLANADVLAGRKASATDAGEAVAIMRSKGCVYTNRNVTIDGDIITGAGAEASVEHARALIQAVSGRLDRE